jgi:adenine-specific DNA-methyltransferase
MLEGTAIQGRLTDFHAKYLAHELTKRCPSDSLEKLAPVLADAQVDLNPHQVEAALFAFRSPFSKGAILADEVGLGKTIEAGLLLAQKWAENRRRLLVIVPANLRKQWSQELEDKFHLPSAILETRTFNEAVRARNLNPFVQPAIILCSYQFARTKEPYLQQTKWDLVVIDEAHRLRNVYKGTSKIATSIKDSVAPFPKVLLTATPLQNSLLELYGLVSIIDDYAFGDLASFKGKYSRLSGDMDFSELKQRLAPVCKRTLRRQVLEYVKYTNRHALVQEFVPTPEEQRLYDLVTEYLQGEKLYALPASQRPLVTLILRKLLASSTHAIAGTLDGLAKRLETAVLASEPVDKLPDEIPNNWENLDELEDEWEEDGEAPPEKKQLGPAELAELRQEMARLREFHTLAKSILKNSKGEVLLTALRRGFQASARARQERGSATLQQKAVIFTESRRTQEYLRDLLEGTEFKGKVLLFNGTNSDPGSKAIYQRWLARHEGTDRVSGSPSADMRAALVDCFRDEASILIATEAAAEGINLQFCNVVVNYDLPWNPQRVEQRIGRCHRYGQKFDVVVVNFLNKSNAADQRVYELLAEKFKLFDGVFGASDEVLGAVESGVDFEKRIASIYQKCRTLEDIKTSFDQLQRELSAQINEAMTRTRRQLLENFDAEVHEKLRINLEQSRAHLNRYELLLMRLTKHALGHHAEFADDFGSFSLKSHPFPDMADLPLGRYELPRRSGDAHLYRIGHPLAQRILRHAKDRTLPYAEVTFDLTSTVPTVSALKRFIGSSGHLLVVQLTIESMDQAEDHVLVTACADSGEIIPGELARRFFSMKSAAVKDLEPSSTPHPVLQQEVDRLQAEIRQEISERNARVFEQEADKLDGWADDLKVALERDIKDLDREIKETKRAATVALTLEEKLAGQKQIKALESQRNSKRKSLFEAQDAIDQKREELIAAIEAKLEQRTTASEVLSLRWRLT